MGDLFAFGLVQRINSSQLIKLLTCYELNEIGKVSISAWIRRLILTWGLKRIKRIHLFNNMYAELVFCMYTDFWNFYNKIDRGKLFLIILISYILVNDIKKIKL